MFNLTDDEALEQLEFNLLWHHALRLDIEETHLPQKTLHNFRVRLMQHDGGRLAFQETTDRIIQALGIRTGKQRLDSTHIMSNIATLTRLGLFCETMRLFLRALRWEELRPRASWGAIPLNCAVAAISVGMVDGRLLVDLPYEEDVRAHVDFNVAMTDSGDLVEFQGAAEGGPFSKETVSEVITLAEKGLEQLFAVQARAIQSIQTGNSR